MKKNYEINSIFNALFTDNCEQPNQYQIFRVKTVLSRKSVPFVCCDGDKSQKTSKIRNAQMTN